MAAMVGKYAANKLLKKQMGKYAKKDVDGGEVCLSILTKLALMSQELTIYRIHSLPWSKTPNAQAK
jgi:hypothetical protein